MTECRSCHAPILWTITRPGGAYMPVDPDPADEGNVHLTDATANTARGSYRVVEVLGPLEVHTHDGPLYLSHFATCPNADQHRTKDR